MLMGALTLSTLRGCSGGRDRRVCARKPKSLPMTFGATTPVWAARGPAGSEALTTLGSNQQLHGRKLGSQGSNLETSGPEPDVMPISPLPNGTSILAQI